MYIGVTSELYERIVKHKEKLYTKSFTAKYNCDKLVWYEVFSSIEEAIAREKQIKGWTRVKKIALIEAMNPQWNDLHEQLYTTS